MREIRRLIDRAAATRVWSLADIELLPPIPRPGKIFAMYGNYADHILEGGDEVPPKAASVPLLFCKLPSTLIGSGAPIILPTVSNAVDWELELAVIIGQRLRNVSVDDAPRFVAGYSIFLDISARAMTYPGRTRFGATEAWFDFLYGKWCDTFAVLGPSLVTADAVADADRLSMQLQVNGRLRQDCSTASMIFTVPEVIAFISRWCTLEPGDVIAMGTPAGTGLPTGDYLRPGDLIVATIEGLGTLSNPVEGPREAALQAAD